MKLLETATRSIRTHMYDINKKGGKSNSRLENVMTFILKSTLHPKILEVVIEKCGSEYKRRKITANQAKNKIKEANQYLRERIEKEVNEQKKANVVIFNKIEEKLLISTKPKNERHRRER
jgi:hypothetical protein